MSELHNIFRKVADRIEKVTDDIEELVSGGSGEKHSHTHAVEGCADQHAEHAHVRYHSFQSPSTGTPKWYVDGASYFWAVSESILHAKESIYILDWWLSPELYLRRPPSRYEQFRLDHMLKAAAERGVQVKVIVYKEVDLALTLDSEHTKHWLEGLHPNIKVFRHPDHYPNGYDLKADLSAQFSNLSLQTIQKLNLAKMPGDAIKKIYGTKDQVVLFWSHHEKLVLIDNRIAYMGGLDLCFGRWDTISHPIADAHPGNVDATVFPGQDFNNARVYDFDNVSNWMENKLDRTKSSRMGWTDISMSVVGPVVDSLQSHFVERWNYIWKRKYEAKDGSKYSPLTYTPTQHHPGGIFGGIGEHHMGDMFRHRPHDQGQEQPGSSIVADWGARWNRHVGRLFDRDGDGDDAQQHHGGQHHGGQHDASATIQITRSCSDWSMGRKTEHSIANAYIDVISKSQHFIYIENQFFITATSDAQRPVLNKIGAALVDRIVQAHNQGEPYRVVVVMPAVPAFAGDLKDDSALGTRAVMEFQYSSICRSEHSILEALKRRGIPDPSRYIGFYNLRNYDRINVSTTMQAVEAQAGPGVTYERARKEHDDLVGAGYGTRGYGTGGVGDAYRRYQEAAAKYPVRDETPDTVVSCYMHGGPDIRSVPWHGSPESELDAFVSEELYVHSKVLIADDRIVICGSANLNDRSQVGNHDSEIAAIIEDPTPVETYMAGRPFTASRFAASLRRYVFRKHLGLLKHQAVDAADANWTPVSANPNTYDFGSPEDRIVRDPLSPEFLELWRRTATTNTEVFSRAFHCVPNDHVKTWEDYDNFFAKYFIIPGSDPKKIEEDRKAGKVEYGHVVRSEFPGGVAELKDQLARIRGTLVDMPLLFLSGVDDIAKENLTSFNKLTDELYT